MFFPVIFPKCSIKLHVEHRGFKSLGSTKSLALMFVYSCVYTLHVHIHALTALFSALVVETVTYMYILPNCSIAEAAYRFFKTKSEENALKRSGKSEFMKVARRRKERIARVCNLEWYYVIQQYKCAA